MIRLTLLAVLSLTSPHTHSHTLTGDRTGIDLHVSVSAPPPPFDHTELSSPEHRHLAGPTGSLAVKTFAALNAARVFLLTSSVPQARLAVIHWNRPGPCFDTSHF